MAERTTVHGFYVCVFVPTTLICPCPVHWTWSGAGLLHYPDKDGVARSFLGESTYADFAGSGIVNIGTNVMKGQIEFISDWCGFGLVMGRVIGLVIGLVSGLGIGQLVLVIWHVVWHVFGPVLGLVLGLVIRLVIGLGTSALVWHDVKHLIGHVFGLVIDAVHGLHVQL